MQIVSLAYVLIIYSGVQGGGVVSSVYFTDKKACETAITDFKKDYKDDIYGNNLNSLVRMRCYPVTTE